MLLNRNAAIVLLLLLLLAGSYSPGPATAGITRLSIVWSLTAPPVSNAMQAELRDMGTAKVEVEYLEESSAATDADDEARIRKVVQAATEAGLPALVVARGEVLQAIGHIDTKPSLKELIQ